MIKLLDYTSHQLLLTKKAQRKNIPLKTMFELTYRCNLGCRHCYVAPPKEKKKELATDEVFVVLDQLADAGCLTVGFTGGEPFVRSDIFEILSYARKKGFIVVVLTNGALLTSEKADRLKEIGVNKIDISFHSLKEETFDWFTRVPGTYTRVLKAIELLRQRNVEVYLKTTAMTINKDELAQIRRLAVEKFGAHFRYSSIVSFPWDGNKDNARFRLSAEEIGQLPKSIQTDSDTEYEKSHISSRNREIQEKTERQGRDINHNELFRCAAGRTEFVINPFGEMKLCMDIPFPKYEILKGTLAGGWNMLSDYARNTPPGPTYACRDCEVAQYCNFCPARGWLECGDMSACPPYYAEMARLAKVNAEMDNRIDVPQTADQTGISG